MSTTMTDGVVAQVCLRASIIEAALHSKHEWTAQCDNTPMGAHVEVIQDGDQVSAKFTVGPMPGGWHYLTLMHSGVPRFSGEFSFVEGQWWTYTVSAKLA